MTLFVRPGHAWWLTAYCILAATNHVFGTVQILRFQIPEEYLAASISYDASPLDKHIVRSVLQCAARCSQNVLCESFNYIRSPRKDENICELNKGKAASPLDLTNRENSTYVYALLIQQQMSTMGLVTTVDTTAVTSRDVAFSTALTTTVTTTTTSTTTTTTIPTTTTPVTTGAVLTTSDPSCIPDAMFADLTYIYLLYNTRYRRYSKLTQSFSEPPSASGSISTLLPQLTGPIDAACTIHSTPKITTYLIQGNTIYCYEKRLVLLPYSACDNNNYVSSVLGGQVPLPLDFAMHRPGIFTSNWCGFKDKMVYCDDGSSYSTADQAGTFYNMPPGVTAGVYRELWGDYLIHKDGNIYLYKPDTHETSYVSQLYCG